MTTEEQKERNREYQKRWAAENPERLREIKAKWRASNKDKKREYAIKYHAANLERDNERSAKWRLDNPEREHEHGSRWNKNNPERRRAITANHRARKRTAEGHYTGKDIERMMKSQKSKCYYCGRDISKSYHVDHIVPLSRGGSNNPSNLVLACPHCNDSKGAKLPHEWAKGGKLL